MEDFILIFNIFFYFLSYKSYKFKYKKYLLFSFQTKNLVNFFLNLSIFISLNFQFKLNYFLKFLQLIVCFYILSFM